MINDRDLFHWITASYVVAKFRAVIGPGEEDPGRYLVLRCLDEDDPPLVLVELPEGASAPSCLVQDCRYVFPIVSGSGGPPPDLRSTPPDQPSPVIVGLTLRTDRSILQLV